MAQFLALNHAFSATTTQAAGTAFTSGPKVAIQLQVPSGTRIRIIEYGVSMDNTTANVPAKIELVQASAATTMTTGHTTSTVVPIGGETQSSRLTMGTTGTGYGANTLATNTTSKYFDSQYVPPTGQFVKQWPLGREPYSDSTGTFVQLRLSVSSNVTVAAYIVWEEV